jgi:glucokinase
VSGREAVKAAQEGDQTMITVFERYGRWLGLGIASVVNTFEPEYVVIGGGVSRASDLFLDIAREEAERNTLPALWERAKVSLARGGADAGVIGAGVLAAQELQRTGDTATT